LRRSLGGHGFALDDLVHLGRSELSDVSDAVLEISKKYSSPEHPIGISDPASEFDILALAQKLEAEGR
jgi:hypothetical protein